MLTKLYPMVQFKPNTWEIDEFDCVSMFLLIGSERALLIDCGIGIGDLRGAVEMITDKPITVVITHGHLDHTANAGQFGEIWIHPKDAGNPIPGDIRRRRNDAIRITRRQKGILGNVFPMYKLYPYDIYTDIREPAENSKPLVMHELYEGQTFDLGGGRIVTAYECPGHSPGQMMFLDNQSHSLFCGDALNFNLGVMACPVETTLKSLYKIRALSTQYDGIYNGHHDFRPLGAPLDDDCLPTAIAMLEDVMAGHIVPCQLPSFWGGDLPVADSTPYPPPPIIGPNDFADRVMLHRGRNFIGIDANKIRE